ncbi:YfcL family protein [Thalassotalea sp. PLHSN55]|uniref:YfcL family protein n=1 Tax=Thalassotalea sp. PLHSN55 TaxID=3435888 RepID=UPI003F833FAA
MKFKNLTDLYQHFDNIVEQDSDADDLFASSYIRGFVALVASEFGDESQPLSAKLSESVDKQLAQAKTELSPQDREIVQQFWLKLKQSF